MRRFDNRVRPVKVRDRKRISYAIGRWLSTNGTRRRIALEGILKSVRHPNKTDVCCFEIEGRIVIYKQQ